MHRHTRMKKELQMLKDSPPPSIACWPKGDSIESLEAQIIGSSGTPYEGGVFKLSIHLPERYPFEPPKMNFLTSIYHPNIDTAGRICLNILKLPPNGGWKPCLNICTVLTSIQVLMNDPNPDDPLMADIAEEFKYKKSEFLTKAASYTKKYASGNSTTVADILTIQDNGAEGTGSGSLLLSKRGHVYEPNTSKSKCPRNENLNI